MAKLNYYAFTATKVNSFKTFTLSDKDVGDEFHHSVFGKGVIVHRERNTIVVRKDITVDQLIEVL